MRISLNWLKDYLDIKPTLSTEKICNSLTMAGLEIEHVHPLGEQSLNFNLATIIKKKSTEKGISLYEVKCDGNIIQAQSHDPDLQTDTVVALKDQPDQDKSIVVFGDVGLEALAGEVIKLEASDLEKNNAKALGELDEYNDIIFTIGVTPNRADALSHLGVSRELSASLELPSRSLVLSVVEMAGPTHEKALIEIENPNDCPRYALRVLENITVDQSPLWLRVRLLACGIRPINNVVDVTNYVMLSRGQPLHAFDYDKLKKDNGRARMTVRKARPEENLGALDGKKLILTTDDLVVCDDKGPVALAGVMGGLESAVSPTTTTILLESAYFEPTLVRKSAKKFGLSTESSYRFERGVDPNGVLDALNLAARLLVEISGGKSCREAIDAYRLRIDPKEIKMRPERALSILGIRAEDFKQEVLRTKFLALGIETVAKRGDAIYFRVPTFRSDLTREIDLIEESARMIGYDKVAETEIGGIKSGNIFEDKTVGLALKKMRECLVARGFFEAINYSFLSKDYHNKFIKVVTDNEPVAIKNPLSERYAVMRQSLVPGLVTNLLHNLRNQERSVHLFEIGTVFLGKRAGIHAADPTKLSGSLDQDSFCQEEQRVAGVACGLAGFQAFDVAERSIDFYDIKGVLSEALAGLGLCDKTPLGNVTYDTDKTCEFMHPGESVSIYYAADKSADKNLLGYLGKLHPDLTSELDLPNDVFVFELDVAALAQQGQSVPQFEAFSRFPMVQRDVAVVVDETVLIDDLLKVSELVTGGQEMLKSVKVFDIYRGKNIEPGKKSVAISFTLQDFKKTLTDEDATGFIDEFLLRAHDATGAKVR